MKVESGKVVRPELKAKAERNPGIEDVPILLTRYSTGFLYGRFLIIGGYNEKRFYGS